ncbi:hypothetical protein [Halothiobacillus sp.]|jgi:hypothetical protein|uniref:hypothetical protein n=1 Tax=Halothiobacillus sp. TaxID=1891311 RepID=UPI002AD5B07A|nr:hypothetical protein [Halothiobacillus sp.]
MASLEYGVNDSAPSGKVPNLFVRFQVLEVIALLSDLFRGISHVHVWLTRADRLA